MYIGPSLRRLWRKSEKPRLQNLENNYDDKRISETTDDARRNFGSGQAPSLRSQRYLRIVNRWIADDPKNSRAYFSRHNAWMRIGEPQRALGDLNRAIELKPTPIRFLARAHVYRHLGEYQKAIEDFDRAEAIDPAEWQDGACSFKPIHTHGSGTNRLHWLPVSACRMTFGLRALKVRPAAAKQRLRMSCADALRRPGGSRCEI
jgi:tetratricopeptide (TPR) repeat protein